MKQRKSMLWVALLTCFLPSPTLGKAKVVKFNNYVYYEGEVENKVPKGRGTLYVSKMPRSHSGEMDRVTGVFDGTSVSQACITFSSGWSFSGNVKYNVTNGNCIEYVLEQQGQLNAPSLYDDATILMPMSICNEVIVRREFSDFSCSTSLIEYEAKANLSDRYTHYGSVPVSFLKLVNFKMAAYLKDWTWQFDKQDTFADADGNKLRIFYRTREYSGGEWTDCLVLANGAFVDHAQSSYRLGITGGAVRRWDGWQLNGRKNCELAYADGDKFTGEVVFVDTITHERFDMPSFDPSSRIFLAQLVAGKNVIPYTGTYKTADGISFSIEKGQTEEELMAQAEAMLEEQQREQAEIEAQRQAARQNSDKKIAEQRKLLNECNGKTFSFQSYFTPWGGKWQLQNGNASIKFWKNGQEIIIRIAGALHIVHFREITAEGELSCYETGDPLYGSWYIKIINNKGKKAFVLHRPLGGIKYLLQ